MPPKRKREAADDGGDGDIKTPKPKKSKKELLAEARARAKAWHDQELSRKAGVGGGGTAKKAPATTGKIPRARANVASPPRTAVAENRKRKPSRKSTGGAVDLIRTTTAPATKIKTEPARKARRASAGTGAGSSTFEFEPPSEKEEEESSEDDVETKDAAVQSAAPPAKYEFGNRDSDEKEERKMSAKKKREDGLAKIRALREQRENEGLPVSHAHHRAHGQRQHPPASSPGERKSPPRRKSLDPPPAETPVGAPATAAEKPPPTAAATFNSPDPPSAAEASAPASTTAKSPAMATLEAVPSKPTTAPNNQPPPSISAIFKRSARGPFEQKVDPNQPVPSAGHRLPAAAYCGSGPTPGSNTTSVRGATSGRGEENNAHMLNDNQNARTNIARESMKLISPVDPPRQMKYPEGDGDDEKMPARPSPPGRNGSAEENAPESVGQGGGGGSNAPVPAVATDTAPHPAAAITPTPAATPIAKPRFLAASISRAKALVTSAAGSNQNRRAMMGIRSNNGGNDQPANGKGADTTLGLPPRDIIQKEKEMDVTKEELDAVKLPVDPPVVESASVPHGRDAGGANAHSSEAKEENKTEDNRTATTVAGEHTSEAGEKKEERNVHADEDSELEPKPSLFKRGLMGLLAFMKLIMFIQLFFGVGYTIAFFLPSDLTLFEWNGDGASTSKKPLESGIQMPEVDAPCYTDHPATEELDDHYVCEGNYMQCPPWGRCHAGKLIDCTDGDGVFDGMNRFVPNERGDGCVPSQDATELTELVKEVLVGMTIAETCQSPFSDGGADFPLFSLHQVALKVEEASPDGISRRMSRDLLLWLRPLDSKLLRFGWLSGDAGKGSGEDVDAVGLGTDVVPGSLPFPFACMMKLLMMEVLGYFAQSALLLLTYSSKMAWFLIATYPLHVTCALALWKVVGVLRRKRKHRAKVRELFGPVLEAVYDRLSECENDDRGYASLLLRDDVAHDMYPTSFRERQFLFDNVWPRVTLEIRADNRVRKFQKVANGKDLEHWDFAIQSKRGRRMRKPSTVSGQSEDARKSVPTKREP